MPFTNKICNIIIKGIRNIWTIAVVALISVNSFASPVSSERAIQIAEDFISKRIDTRGLKPKLSVKYGNQATDSGYYIIADDNDQCFAIVSADTRLPEILGYSLNGGYDADNVNPTLKWWLTTYDQQIKNYLDTDPKENTTRGLHFQEYDGEIYPMTKSKWNQGDPYNKKCPTVKGEKCVTGCLATALAQLLYYNKWPESPVGDFNGYDFNNTEYDYEQMLDEYHYGYYTTAQANAVALLMLQCGKAVDMDYTPYESGAQGNMTVYALTEHFKYSQSLRMRDREFYSAKQWEEMVYSELQAGRPIIYAGHALQGGHAFICDGYEDGFYHFNWGWGGYQDGYFKLNALNPETGGIGSYLGGYNSYQTIFTGVVKDDGSTDRQYEMYSTGGFIYKDGAFTCEASQGMEYGIFYNPMPYNLTTNIGLKITDSQGRYICHAPASQDAEEIKPNWGYDCFSVDLPPLEDGRYNLTPAFLLPNGTWQDVKVVYGTQQSVSLIIEDGKESYINDGIPANMITNMIVSEPVLSYEPSKGVPTTITYYVYNQGPGDYNGMVMAEMKSTDNSDPSRDVQLLVLPAGQYDKVTFTVTAPNSDDAQIAFLNQQGQQIGETTNISLGNKRKDRRTPTRSLDIEIASPLSANYWDNPFVMIHVCNLTEYKVETKLSFEIYNSKGTLVKTMTTDYLQTVPKECDNFVQFGNVSFELNPDHYWWQVTDGNGIVFSQPYPLEVYLGPSFSLKSEFEYNVVNDTECVLTRPEYATYSESIEIPTQMDKYQVTSWSPDIFLSSPALNSLSFPENTQRIGSMLLCNLPKLNKIQVKSESPFAISPFAMESGQWNRIWLEVPKGSESKYMSTPIWSNFAMPHWDLDIDPNVSIKGLPIREDDSMDDPLYVGYDQPIEIEVEAPTGKYFNIHYYVLDGGPSYYENLVSEKITLPALGAHIGKLSITLHDAWPGTVEELHEQFGCDDIFTTAGNTVKRDATLADFKNLEPGIYIYKGNKIIIGN